MKMSVNDAAERFGVSKEAIHNRIRRGSLEAVVEDGVKMVLVDEQTNAATPKKAPARASAATRATTNNDRYYKFLEEQNAKLQSRIETLEGETRTLRDQKELMLVQEREKIEAIYRDKDEQLKNILSTLASKFMLGAPEFQTPETLDVEVEDAQELQEQSPDEPLQAAQANIITLKKYVKKLKLSDKKAKKVMLRFEKRAKKDRRIITVGEKIYLDTLRYDYSDLV